MTIQEKANLLTKEFDELWKNLWGDYFGVQYRSEEKNAKEKFYQIKEGVHLFDDTFFNLEKLIQQSTTNWTEPEWGFPKGRRNYQESDISCALREFSEETGIQKNNILIGCIFFLIFSFVYLIIYYLNQLKLSLNLF